MCDNSTTARVIAETRRWLQQIVLRHNFCPFAHKPFQQETIHYIVCLEKEPEAVIAALIEALLQLRDSDISVIETTLFITPNCFNAFDEYNDFLTVVDALIEQLNLAGTIQVASFHPDYQFADLGAADVRNFTNRSLHPLFHLIREASVEHARAAHPDVLSIPQTNMELLKRRGLEATLREIEHCRLK